MSPAVGNFVHDLVEMAKAMETLPQIEEMARQLQAKLDEAQRHNAGLEENIIGYKGQIEALQAKNHELEVARDDAEYRFLELDEKAHKVVGNMEAIEALVKAARDQLSPPKPEPVEHPTIQEPNPATATDVDYQRYTDASHRPLEVATGQSESPPTIHAVSGEERLEQTSAISSVSEGATSDTSSIHSPIPPYDPEPTRYDYYGNTRQEWWDWSDRQAKHAAS